MSSYTSHISNTHILHACTHTHITRTQPHSLDHLSLCLDTEEMSNTYPMTFCACLECQILGVKGRINNHVVHSKSDAILIQYVLVIVKENG